MSGCRVLCVTLVIALLAVLAPSAQAVATYPFSYQGKLTSPSGTPLTGAYNMQFKLFDALTAGNQIGTTNTINGVTVTKGLFNVPLDFGLNFGGSRRWIETVVGGEVLAPRTEVIWTPTATYSASVNWSGVSGAPTTLPPSGPASGDLTGSYPAPTIAANAITTAKIQDDAVTAQKIALGAITSSELATDQFSLSKVSGGAMSSVYPFVGIGRPTPTELFQIYGQIDLLDQSFLPAVTSDIVAPVWWQSFTAGVTSKLVAVSLIIGVPASMWSGTLRIYSGQGTAGPVLSTAYIAGTDIAERKYILPSTVSVTQGAVYTIAFTANSLSSQLRYSSSGGYAGGALSETGGAAGAGDAWFKTFTSDNPNSPALVVRQSNFNVGIGLGNPSAKLHVVPDSASNGLILGSTATGSTYLNISLSALTSGYVTMQGTKAAGSAAGDIVLNPGGGNVVAGPNPLSTGGYRLYVNGLSYFNSDMRVNGAAIVNSLVYNTSDARYKKNVQTIPGALQKVLRLHGVSFDWKCDENKGMNFPAGRQVGFVAQEVAKVVPEIVRKDGQGSLAVSYSSMAPLLVEAIKEQQKQIAALTSENAALKAKIGEIDVLKARMEALTALVRKQEPGLPVAAAR